MGFGRQFKKKAEINQTFRIIKEIRAIYFLDTLNTDYIVGIEPTYFLFEKKKKNIDCDGQ